MAEFAIPNAGVLRFLDWMLKEDTSLVEQLALRLYTSLTTPGRNSVTADFTEATFGGYSQRILARSDFGPATLDANTGRITLSGAALSWLPTTSGQVLQGSFIVGVGSNLLYSARLFATPREVTAGTRLKLFPVWTLTAPAVA